MNIDDFNRLCGKTKSKYLKRYFYIPRQTKLWRTKTGKTVRICDMDDQHLLNCIDYIVKYDLITNIEWDDYPQYENDESYIALTKEVKKRGLL